jgi:hypothetical protein
VLISGGDRWQDVAKNIANDVFNSLAREFMLKATGGEHGSFGSLLGGLLGSVLSGFFGFGKVGGVKPSGVPSFAGGGFHAGGWAMVGEDGPELVNLSRPAHIYSADETQAMLSGGGQRPIQVVNHFNIQAPRGTVTPETQMQIAARVAASLEQARRRNG